MILGIGIDLCAIDQMVDRIENTRFLERFFTEEEIEYIKGKNLTAAQSAAGIFAAKEAALKAFGTGMTLVSVREISVLHRKRGQPYYRLYGKAKELMEKMGGKAIHLSISHEGNIAVAFAVIEGNDTDENHYTPADKKP